MIKIVAAKGIGKTTNLIKMSAETNEYIVCKDNYEARRIQDQATEMGLEIPFPLTFDEFLSEQYFGKGVKGVLIDNADMLIQSISKVPVRAITMRE